MGLALNRRAPADSPCVMRGDYAVPEPHFASAPATSVARRRLLPPRGQVVAVAVGGAIGAPARYELTLQFHAAAGQFPWTTFGINVSGAFVLGLLITLPVERLPATRYARSLLCTGLLGAFTTFATFAVEITTLGRDGHVVVAITYACASVVLGLIAALAGIACGRASGTWEEGRRR